MSWKTLVAFLVFCMLTASLLTDDSSQVAAKVNTDSVPAPNYDFALTSQELVFSESMKAIETPAYLIPSQEIEQIGNHSATVILRSLSALPASEESAGLILSSKESSEQNSEL